MQTKADAKIVPIFSGGGTRLSCYIGILQALLDMGFVFKHWSAFLVAVSSLHCMQQVGILLISKHFHSKLTFVSFGVFQLRHYYEAGAFVMVTSSKAG